MPQRFKTARIAQQHWASMSVAERLRHLKKLRFVITDQLDAIVTTISDEIGKPQMDALTGDVMLVLESIRFLEKQAVHALASHRVGKPSFLFSGVKFREHFEPHGVVLIIAPWNYPFQLALVPAITALAAGNAVVLKCSEHAKSTATIISSLIEAAGFPTGLLEVRTDRAEDVPALIAERPDFIFFTGSSKAGHDVAVKAAESLIPLALELGGKDPCLIFESCNLERAIRGACYASFSNSGQTCVGAKRIYVQRSIWDRFLNGFTKSAAALRIGTSTQSDMGPIRIRSVRENLRIHLNDAINRGAKLHSEWNGESETVPPLILTGVPRDALLHTAETFGPIVCLEPFDNETEAVQLANSSPFGLGASLYTQDAAQADRVASALHSGSCSVNDSIRSVGNPYAAFGGNGRSGYGRYHGVEGLRTFSRIKTISKLNHTRSREIHWFPFTPSTFNALRGLLLLRHSRGLILKRMVRAWKHRMMPLLFLLWACSTRIGHS